MTDVSDIFLCVIYQFEKTLILKNKYENIKINQHYENIN